MYIPMPKRSTRQPLALRFINDPVPRTLIRALGPPLNHVPAVDDVHIFQRWNMNPLLPILVPHFQTMLARLLEQDCDATEVGMGPDAELTREVGVLRRVTDHLHGNDRSLGEVVHQGWRLTETLEQDRPDTLAELAGLLIIRPDWTPEVVFWEVGPDIGTVETGELYDWILPGHIEALFSLLAVQRDARRDERQ